MKKETIAIKYFKEGFNCAQSVLISYKDELFISEEDLLKISCGFGSGMGRLQEICGAVSGAFMVIGLKFGKYLKEDNVAREKTYRLVREFESEFKKKQKSSNCREILGCDLLTDEGNKQFLEKNLREIICEKCVKEAVKLLSIVIKQNE